MSAPDAPERFDAIVVGAGFAGLYMLHRLREEGLSVQLLEAGDGVGGTWHWNRYPGARVDVESMSYSYSFSPQLQQEWSWTENYAARDELKAYADHVVERFGLGSHIRLGTRVVGARYDEDAATWTVTTEAGDQLITTFLVTAVGALSTTNRPMIPGLEEFGGTVLHTSRWPAEDVDLTGKRVGVIGTGSTGIQVIPVVARKAARLTVFQRTANFSLPVRNEPMDPEFEREWKAHYDEHRAAARLTSGGSNTTIINMISALDVSPQERERIYEQSWRAGGSSVLRSFQDIMTSREANDTAADFVRRKIREIVHDPVVAERLCPKDHPIGSKRICMDNGYFETYNRDNVELVDLRAEPIVAGVAEGLRTERTVYPLDLLILATGFDAVTGPLREMGIVGRDGVALADKWADGPLAYLGLATAGFPNLLTLTGPGSPAVLANGFTSIEQHVGLAMDVINQARERGARQVEVTSGAEIEWMEHVAEVADRTLYPQAKSWYLGSNIPGRPRVFMLYAGGAGNFRRRCEDVVAAGFTGFEFG